MDIKENNINYPNLKNLGIEINRPEGNIIYLNSLNIDYVFVWVIYRQLNLKENYLAIYCPIEDKILSYCNLSKIDSKMTLNIMLEGIKKRFDESYPAKDTYLKYPTQQ